MLQSLQIHQHARRQRATQEQHPPNSHSQNQSFRIQVHAQRA